MVEQACVMPAFVIKWLISGQIVGRGKDNVHNLMFTNQAEDTGKTILSSH